MIIYYHSCAHCERNFSCVSEITMPSDFIERKKSYDQLATLLKLYTSSNVNMFEGSFRALPERPAMLSLILEIFIIKFFLRKYKSWKTETNALYC